MVFSSTVFLFLFLPALLLGYYLIPGKLRNSWLLLGSLLFYAWGEDFFVLLMLASILLNYALGLAVRGRRGSSSGRWIVAVAVIVNLGFLGWFKYANFLGSNLDLMLLRTGFRPLELEPIHLPIGISFFTFQALSYVVDIYRGAGAVQRNPLRLALYISMFPQLIAGPIVRYKDVASQLLERSHDLQGFASGVQRFVIGLGKKVLIANAVALPADQIFSQPAEGLYARLAWFGVGCYALQIYFDFSGYSDMAIGLGRMFGFRFLENFDYPYISRSIQEFWRRWHISLSSWYRDYLYIPLGGNRCAPARVYFNLFVVFFLCGLWHGASWSFVVWGLFHGTFIALERGALAGSIGRLWRPAQHVYTLLVVLVGWVFFRADSLPYALDYLGAMFGMADPTEIVLTPGGFLDGPTRLAVLVGVIGCSPVLPWLSSLGGRRRDGDALRPRSLTLAMDTVGLVALVLIYVASAMTLASGTYNPFIYFRF